MQISYLQYADDTILVGQQGFGSKRLINAFDDYILMNGHELNVKKTKIMKICPANQKFKSWRARRGPIEVVKTYRYLAVMFDNRVSFKCHFKDLRAKTMTLMHAFKCLQKSLSCQSYEHILKFMRAKLQPTISCGSTITRGKDAKLLDLLIVKAYKATFGIPRSVSQAEIRLEFGLQRQCLVSQGAFFKMYVFYVLFHTCNPSEQLPA